MTTIIGNTTKMYYTLLQEKEKKNTNQIHLQVILPNQYVTMMTTTRMLS